MKDVLWISLGAVLGANLRYGVQRLVGHLVPYPFPLGTLLINISGSFLLGVFFEWTRARFGIDPRWRLIFAVGFCGGYTTFSAFAWDSVDLLRMGRPALFALNVIASNLLAFLAVVGGIALVHTLAAPRA